MCTTCGCNLTHGNRHLVSAGGHLENTASGRESVEVLEGLLAANDRQAAHNREHFDEHDVLAVNLMSSPGAGKTTLLEATIDLLGEDCSVAVVEGDLETDIDALRIRAKGVPAVQITTGSACHLDAHMLHGALHDLDLDTIDLLFIENVGNLVCPAAFDLGQHVNITLLSVPEGHDKPSKYPVMFRSADLVLVTKCDLIPALGDFDLGYAMRAVRRLANAAPVIEISAKTGAGMATWRDWLLAARCEALRPGDYERTDPAAKHSMQAAPHA